MSHPAPLPVTVISGYLGAGKTSLINHLLRNAGGRRIMVMVNDFGELDIDADLLKSADEDTLTLSNGCICCTMGTELLYALGEALDRRPRPDCLVIEASGVAEPAKIAAAHAEPDMRYCGIVAMMDAANVVERLSDPLIGAQIAGQLRAADLILASKTDIAPLGPAAAAVAEISAAPILSATRGEAPIDLILERPEASPPKQGEAAAHGDVYRSWSTIDGCVSREALKALFAAPPPGLYRFKGRIALREGGAVEAHLVGRTFEIRPCEETQTRAVAIGVAQLFDVAAFEAAWRKMAN